MQIIREPTIYLIGRSEIATAAIDQFLADNATSWQTDTEVGAERIAELAGRICYMSLGTSQGRRSNHEYLENILEQQHGSVLEHAVWNFLITGVSRSFTHELVRHRAGTAISQLSQRYVDESQVDFVEPAVIAGDPQLHAIWSEAIAAAHAAYVALSDRLAGIIEAGYPQLAKRERRRWRAKRHGASSPTRRRRSWSSRSIRARSAISSSCAARRGRSRRSAVSR